MAFPDGWGRRCALVIQSSQVPESVTDFPVLFTRDNLPTEMYEADSGYAALDGGGDIRFSSDENGSNRLACEISRFETDNNPSSAKVEIYVKVPSISSSSDTTIYVWYNKSGETQPAVTDTYGRNAVWSNGFVYVWHGNEDSGTTATDATGQEDGTLNGTLPNRTPYSFFNNGFYADSYAQYMDHQDSDSVTGFTETRFDFADNFLISAWMNFYTNPTREQNFGTGSGQYVIGTDVADEDDIRFNVTGASSSAVAVYAPFVVNTWYWVAGRFDQTETQDTSLFIDGISQDSDELGEAVKDTGQVFGINYDGGQSRAEGKIVWDEVRVVDWNSGGSRRTDNWLLLEYRSMSIPGTLVVDGTPVTPGTTGFSLSQVIIT